MRIAMVSTPFVSVPPQNYGGTELVVYELERQKDGTYNLGTQAKSIDLGRMTSNEWE